MLGLNQRLQAVESTLRQTTATAQTALTKASATNTSSGSSGSSVLTPQFTWTEVASTTLISTGAAVGWTTLNLSSYLASGASRIQLNGYADLNALVGGFPSILNFRVSNGAVTRTALYFSKVGAQTFTLEMPVTTGLTIDYQVLRGFTDLTVNLVEYLVVVA